jgi:hypothetical protein
MTTTTPKINNPQNFRTSNTLTTTRKPHYATKVNTAFSVIPGMHRPNANNVPSNINQGDFIGPNFKARPLKHWRRQLVPTNPSTDNSSQKRMATVNLMDTPGSTVYKTNAESCKCVETGGNSFQIEDAYAKNKCDEEKKIQNNGAISVPTYVVNDEGYKIITGVYDTVRISCNPENNRIRSGICTLSQAYYETRSGYLQSRCRTAAQRLSTTKKADGVYYASDNILFEFLYPTNEPNGPQVYQSKNCSNPKTYNNNALNQPANSYCSTIYKPNNAQFACQGAVSGSTRLQKLKADTITSNGFSFYSAYGATMANAGNFQGTNTSSNYYVKNRNYPLDGFIHLNKYRENKQLACCNPPQNFADPSISGSLLVGSLLSVISNGTWSNNPTSFAYQWYRGANPIPNQTSVSYTIVAGDIGSAITCQVIATSTGGSVGSNIANSNSIVVAASFVAVGQGTNRIVYSADGNTWLPSSNGNTIFTSLNGVNDVAWNGSIWVAVGSGLNKIATSPDGVTWTASTSANAIFNGLDGCRGIAWSSSLSRWVAVGQGGTNSIATSTDGVHWFPAISDNTIFEDGNGVAWSSSLSRWVAVGGFVGGPNTIVYSTDGSTWFPSINGNSTFNIGEDVAWNGSIWVAVGYGPNTNTIATSLDGITWTASLNGNAIFDNSGVGVAWSSLLSKWVAVGNGTNTTIATSTNGSFWIASNNGNAIFTSGEGVAWSSSLSMWVAVGLGNSIATSTNGSDWTVSSNGNSLITNGFGVGSKN